MSIPFPSPFQFGIDSCISMFVSFIARLSAVYPVLSWRRRRTRILLSSRCSFSTLRLTCAVVLLSSYPVCAGRLQSPGWPEVSVCFQLRTNTLPNKRTMARGCTVVHDMPTHTDRTASMHTRALQRHTHTHTHVDHGPIFLSQDSEICRDLKVFAETHRNTSCRITSWARTKET